MRISLKHITVDKSIADRYYQEAAIKAVCNSFDDKTIEKHSWLWLQDPAKQEL